MPEYQVERLDRLMIRMITAELSGRRLAPDEVIAIEQGRAVTSQPMPEARPRPGQLRPRAASAPRAPARRQADSYVPIWTALAPPRRWAVLLALIAGACLLDGNDVRRAWGTYEGCRQEFEQLRLWEKLPPVRGKVVVTVHGLGHSRQALAGMGEYLAREGGFTWINFSYASTRDSIDAHGKALGQVIGELNEVEEVHFVAHSLGNLVVRRYLTERALAEPDAHRPPLGRFVMLAPPNQGAQLAAKMGDGELYRLILGASGSQLAADWDDVESRLAIPPCPFGIVAGGGGDGGLNNPLLEGDDDLVVTVAETRLAGAADLVVVPVWHAFIMDAPVVRQYTLRFLQNGYFVSPQARQPIPPPEDSR